MPNQKIDLANDDPYVLEGKVVTMGPEGIVSDGAIYIHHGQIQAVQDASADVPSVEFAGAERIKTGGTIYPGLVELHNHLAYNAVPLWLVPKAYENNGQWRGKHETKRNVSHPAQVLGNTDGVLEAVIRFVECRALFGGVTTSQGITLVDTNAKSHFPGLVRNVEKPLLAGLPTAHTRISEPPNKEADKEKYLNQQKGFDCLLAHQSEGVNPTARGWFLRLQRDDGSWAIHESFCGIHCTALLREDFDVLVAHQASMIWSPLSNYLLYGDTIDLSAAKESGVLMGLGSDWAPSGSKNLLGELKVAWLASEEAGGIFSAEELVKMVTVNAAQIVGWEDAVGSIQPGRRADLMILNQKTGDPFDRLINARETTVTLVTIDGVPRLGQKRMMSKRFDLQGVEEIEIGSSDRELHLHQEDAHELVQGLTFAEAESRLKDTLENLPARAASLDDALLAGSLDDALLAGSVGSLGSTTGLRYRLDLELEEGGLDTLEGSLVEDLFEMQLEPATVAGDGDHLAKLVAALNLPDFVKDGLPALYGKSKPAPFEAERRPLFLSGLPKRANATVETLRDFLHRWRKLTLEERMLIVQQALLLLSDNYVHLPFKRSMHAVDPVQRLRLLHDRLEELQRERSVARQAGEPLPPLPPDMEFHRELTGVFHSLRDLHTSYRLPDPFRGVVAWLPFMIEEFREPGEDGSGFDSRRFLISKVVGEEAKKLKACEVLYWNGTPIRTAVARNADRQAGSNEHARWARGLNSLTIRPLGRGLPPDEDWVTLRYRTKGGDVKETRMEWLVFVPERALRSVDPSEGDTIVAASIGMDDHTDDIQEAKRVLFAPPEALEEAATERGETIEVEGSIPTSMPTVFRARKEKTALGEFGYLRIFTFNVDEAQEFVDEFERLVRKLSKKRDKGLIVDVRGNGGGLIPAAEGSLQLLTARPIEPQRAQFINTARNLRLCEKHPDNVPRSANLERWVDSIHQSVRTGAIYSLGFSLTPERLLLGIEQAYFKPVVLVTDALCYSATDMFAAGFQDHEIGPILGVAENTGAGGANAWSHGLLRQLWDVDGPTDNPYLQLPENADFRLAMRRTIRVGLNAGGVVEDLGIRPDEVHLMTRRDLEDHNRDLIECAARTLVQWESGQAPIEIARRRGKAPRICVDRQRSPADMSITVRMRHHATEDAEEIDLQALLAGDQDCEVDIEVRGVSEDGESFVGSGRLGRASGRSTGKPKERRR